MLLADKIKSLDNKMKANQGQYNLDREAAKIYIWSSCKLDKQKYVAGKDLGYISVVVEQANFEYFSLG